MKIKRDILWRVAIIYLGILFLAFFIIGRILYLQVFAGSEYSQKAKSVAVKDITIEPNRGDIYSANGRLLATSIPYYEVRMDVNSTGLDKKLFHEKLDSLARGLAGLFGDKSPYAYKKELISARNGGSRYHLIKRSVTYQQLQALKKLPILRLGRYKGGFIVIQHNQRILPHMNLAARTIGYTNQGPTGNVVGLEGAYDHYLKGVVGVRLMRKLPGEVWIPLNDNNEIEPRDGKDIITTIDVNLQDVAESALLRQLIKVNAHHGCAVVMEVSTGEIKAISNLQRDEQGHYAEMYNYAVGESTEPGSTFKLPVLLAAMEDGYVDLYDTIDAGNGVVEYYGVKMTDSRKGGYGRITVKEAFEYSSNVGLSKLVNRCYKGKETKFIDRLYSMRLNERTGLEIKGEGKPFIKYPGDKFWSGLTLPWMAIGYEVQMTPLQILTFYNAIANNGRMMKPKFVKAISDHGKAIKKIKDEVINPSICSMSTIAKAKIMLEGVVENGTAKNLRNHHYKIAGKTGTAQIANQKYGYEQEGEVSYQASFVGYFPAQNPKYSCIVVVNSPTRSVYYGNLVAGPVFREIADKVYSSQFQMIHLADQQQGNKERGVEIPYSKHSHRKELYKVLHELEIPFTDEVVNSEWVVTFRKDSCIELKNRFVHEEQVPNIVGMGGKDAIYILENLGLNVEMQGRGFVQSQSLKPGTLVQKGDKIILELS